MLYGPEAVRQPAVLIAGGLGVAQCYYSAFAGWLAKRDHIVMTFDLRGIGASRQPQHRHSPRGLNADRLMWERSDFPSAVAHLVALNSGELITGPQPGAWAYTGDPGANSRRRHTTGAIQLHARGVSQ